MAPMDRVARHVAAFNAAVRSGNWSSFADRFDADATMAFHGVPAGPFVGREAIRAAYASDPPDDTLEVTRVDAAPDADVVAFRWSRGGTGSMRIRWRDSRVASLDVTFDA